MDWCCITKPLGTPKEAVCPYCGFTRMSSSIKGETQCSQCGKYFVFDYERKREYLRNWRINNPKKYKKQARKNNARLSRMYEELRNHFENKCDLLGCENTRLEFHEVNGVEHPMNPVYIRDHIEDFVLLCQSCHEATHWAMSKLGIKYPIFKIFIDSFDQNLYTS